jgi:hypothetical protein
MKNLMIVLIATLLSFNASATELYSFKGFHLDQTIDEYRASLMELGASIKAGNKALRKEIKVKGFTLGGAQIKSIQRKYTDSIKFATERHNGQTLLKALILQFGQPTTVEDDGDKEFTYVWANRYNETLTLFTQGYGDRATLKVEVNREAVKSQADDF